MNQKRINITCATDDNYAPYCGVMLTSVFENHKNCEVHVYILIDNLLRSDNQRSFAELANKYGQYIHYCIVDNSFLSNFPLKGDGIDHWSIVTYYRLYVAELLPPSIDLVLYLDCDIIVNHSLEDLFDADWSGIAIGVVPDMCTEWQEFYDRLQYNKSLGYFNAGVVLINLSYWRNHQIGQECLLFLKDHYDRIFNNDQDVLNYVLRDRKRTLHVTYNFQIQLLMNYFFDSFSIHFQQEIRETNCPKIIHYAAEIKPWMVKYYAYPFNDIWHYYKNISLWRNMRCTYPSKRAWATFIKRYFLWPLGLKLSKPKFIID